MADIRDKFIKVGSPGTLTTLQAPGKPIAATSLLLTSPVNWDSSTAVIFSMQRIDISTGAVIPGSYTVWKGLLTGSSIDSLQIQYGSDQAYAAGVGTQVFIYVSSVWANSIIDGLLKEHNADGSHKPMPGMYAPVGTIWETAVAVEPLGWLFARGQAVSRTTYAALFVAIGTAYGAGDGLTTFNLPNRKGRVGVGLDPADTDFDTLGKSGGVKSVSITEAQMPTHRHRLWRVDQENSGWGLTGSSSFGGRILLSASDGQADAGNSNTSASGGGAAHTNVQPFTTLNYIIKS